LVHAAPTTPDDKKKVQQKETRIEQLAHIQEQPLVPLSDATDEEKAGAPIPVVAPVVELPRDTQKFLSFAETHRTVLNQVK
jgi:E3 ubiquitin-protein ligase HUWE1